VVDVANLTTGRHWKFQLAMRPVGLGLLAWSLLGGPIWGVFAFAAIVLVTTADTMLDPTKRQKPG
jgi:hypothetical protein